MSSGLVVVDPLADPAWSALLVRSSPTIFHQQAWLELLSTQYHYPVYAWCVRGGDGRLAAGLPLAHVRSRLTGKRLVALPFSDSCVPLFDPESNVDAAAFGRALDDHSRRLGVGVEVHGAIAGAPAAPGDVYLRHVLPLEPDVARVEAAITRTQIGRGIRKAVREGVTIERRSDRAALMRFYDMHLETRRRQGVPTQPRRFILGFERIFAAGHGFVLLARHSGRDVAAAVFLTGGSTLTYKYGASRRQDLHLRPNNLLFMEAIRWGCANDYRVLDFGRTDPGNAGLAAFKRSWGAEESTLGYTYLGRSVARRAHTRSRRLLSGAIRHSPASFGRLVGEALYRELA